MRVQLTDLPCGNARLRDSDLHGSARAVSVFGSGGDVMGVGCRAISDELGEWLGAAGKRMAQGFDDEHSCSFSHDEAVA